MTVFSDDVDNMSAMMLSTNLVIYLIVRTQITTTGLWKRQWMNICLTILTGGFTITLMKMNIFKTLWTGDGPTEEGVEEYKEQFAEDDPK